MQPRCDALIVRRIDFRFNQHIWHFTETPSSWRSILSYKSIFIISIRTAQSSRGRRSTTEKETHVGKGQVQFHRGEASAESDG